MCASVQIACFELDSGSGDPHANGVNEVTQILEAAQDGDATAAEKLLPLVYKQLRALAAHNMARTNKVAAVATLIAINSAYAMIIDHNYRVARNLR